MSWSFQAIKTFLIQYLIGGNLNITGMDDFDLRSRSQGGLRWNVQGLHLHAVADRRACDDALVRSGHQGLERVDQPAQPSPLSAPTWKYGRGPERAAHRGVDSDDLPIYKPALDEVVKRGRGRNLFLSTEVQGAIKCWDGRPRSVRRVVVQLHLFLQ